MSTPGRVGRVGVLARVAVGTGFILFELLVRGPSWQDFALGLVVLPSIVIGLALLRSRRAPRPLRATGPVGHALNVVLLLPLFVFEPTAGGAFLFYGASMLVAAARHNGGCEVTAISNALLRRDDQVGCVFFAPVDLLEAGLRQSSGARRAGGPARCRRAGTGSRIASTRD
jgi:hypothetical protein